MSKRRFGLGWVLVFFAVVAVLAVAGYSSFNDVSLSPAYDKCGKVSVGYNADGVSALVRIKTGSTQYCASGDDACMSVGRKCLGVEKYGVSWHLSEKSCSDTVFGRGSFRARCGPLSTKTWRVEVKDNHNDLVKNAVVTVYSDGQVVRTFNTVSNGYFAGLVLDVGKTYRIVVYKEGKSVSIYKTIESDTPDILSINVGNTFATPAGGTGGTKTLRVEVKDNHNDLVKNAVITVYSDSDGQVVRTVNTGSNGYFAGLVLDVGKTYRIVVYKESKSVSIYKTIKSDTPDILSIDVGDTFATPAGGTATSDYVSGMWCGYSGPVDVHVLCEGNKPSVSCPAGFVQRLISIGTFTCIKY